MLDLKKNPINFFFLVVIVFTGLAIIPTAYAQEEAEPPDAPTALQVGPGNTQATLFWTAPTDQGSTSITDYKIEHKLFSDSSFTSTNTGSTATTGTITGLTNGQLYIFQVKAVNGAGDSTASNQGVIAPSANANTDHRSLTPPDDPSSAIRDAMIAKGISANFQMPSATTVTSGNFDPFDESFNQFLLFTSAFDPSGGGGFLVVDPFDTYNVQQYFEPTRDANTIWSIPPTIATLEGNVGQITIFRADSVTADSPTYFPATNSATKLANEAQPVGLELTLAATATGVKVDYRMQSTPPLGVNDFGSDFYLDFTLTGTGLDSSSTASFSGTTYSFFMGPITGSADPNSPQHNLNSATTCPEMEMSLVVGTSETNTVIATRNPSADEGTLQCAYTFSPPSFSTYTGSAKASSGGAGSIGSGFGKHQKCERDGFGSGISLKIYEISYDVSSENAIQVIAASTCGPIILEVTIPQFGRSIGALSSDQPLLDEGKIILSSPLDPEAKRFSLLIRDKMDSFSKTFPVNQPKFKMSFGETTGYTSEQQGTFQKSSESSIPEWIKNNAKWWSEGQIDDSDFVSGIQFMMKNKIIDIPDLPQQASETIEEKVPDWIKTNAGWWADGQITEDDFVKGIEYLVKVGIIRV